MTIYHVDSSFIIFFIMSLKWFCHVTKMIVIDVTKKIILSCYSNGLIVIAPMAICHVVAFLLSFGVSLKFDSYLSISILRSWTARSNHSFLSCAPRQFTTAPIFIFFRLQKNKLSLVSSFRGLGAIADALSGLTLTTGGTQPRAL